MPRPKLTEIQKDEAIKLYLTPMSLKSVGNIMRIAPITVMGAIIEAGLLVRPKHIVIDNVSKGSDKSGSNNGMWKGGIPLCSSCGGKKKSYVGKKCVDCDMKFRTDNAIIYESELERKRSDGAYRTWRTNVLNRDGNSCIICGCGDRIVAHHLESYGNNVARRYDVLNGVSMCELHHIEFHRLNGYKSNTVSQFETYYLNSIETSEVIYA